jgi:HKD family nuclease
MSKADYISQPLFRSTLDALQSVLQDGEIEQFDVAVAYITAGGAYDLVRRAASTLGDAWDSLPKRWITSFDYCRTEPVALKWLRTLPNSAIRVYDADFCLQHDCAPRVPFHPKAFLVRSGQHDFALAGSGNMSRSGLSRGVEAGLVIGAERAPASKATEAASAVQAIRTWFSRTWRDAAPLTAPRLASYGSVFERRENLRAPVPTEDDVASTDTGRSALTTRLETSPRTEVQRCLEIS